MTNYENQGIDTHPLPTCPVTTTPRRDLATLKDLVVRYCQQMDDDECGAEGLAILEMCKDVIEQGE